MTIGLVYYVPEEKGITKKTYEIIIKGVIMKLYLTRHGQTDWNLKGLVQGRVDIDLNDNGINQAKITAEKLKDTQLDLIICSPLKRAKQTADIINENRNIPIIYDDRIIERDFGEFQGVVAEFSKAEFLWDFKKEHDKRYGESLRDFFKRVYELLDEVQIKYSDKKVLLVCHGGVSIPIQCYFNGIPQQGRLPYGIKNCEVVSFDFDKCADKNY